MNTPLTIEQFRAARRAVDELADAVPPDFSEQYSGPGIVYPGDLVIELSHDSDDYVLTIGNHQQTGALADLEEVLYAWALREEIDAVTAPVTVKFSEVMAMYPNFAPVNTGGGCMAMIMPLDDGGELLVTDAGGPGNLPTDDARSVIVGRYDKEGNVVGGDANTPEIAIDQLEDWIDKQFGEAP